MIELDKDLLETFNSVNFDDYISSSEFEKNRDQNNLEKDLEEAFNSINFEEYKVPISSGNSRKCNCCNCHDFENYVDYNSIVELSSVMFDPEIIDRGDEYYEEGRVLSVVRNENTFYANVMGRRPFPYKVFIKFNNFNEVEVSCDCPCEFNCKHEYAVMNAILNEEYETVCLKEFTNPKDTNLMEMLERIPAEDFKNYCLNEGADYVSLEEIHFKEYFKKYTCTQSFNYYYNNLYNSLVLKDDPMFLLHRYYENMKDYIECGYFKEVIKILKAIVDAYSDSNNISTVEFINVIRDITMFYRVTYNNVSNFDKNEIEKWIYEISSKNYYNNYYLKDMIESVK